MCRPSLATGALAAPGANVANGRESVRRPAKLVNMGIPGGLIDFFYHPPLSLMKRSSTAPVALANPYSGSGNILCHDTGILPKYAYGFRWAINTSPTGAGREARAIVTYEQPWFAFALHYKLSDGTDFIADQVETGIAEGFWIWAIALPDSLTYSILPGFTAHLDWIIGA